MSYSLEDMKRDIEAKFKPVILDGEDGEVFKLRAVLRLSDKERDTVLDQIDLISDLQDNKGTAKEDMGRMRDAALDVLKTVVADGKGKKLEKALNGDLGLILHILETWTEATQPGEAERSQT